MTKMIEHWNWENLRKVGKQMFENDFYAYLAGTSSSWIDKTNTYWSLMIDPSYSIGQIITYVWELIQHSLRNNKYTNVFYLLSYETFRYHFQYLGYFILQALQMFLAQVMKFAVVPQESDCCFSMFWQNYGMKITSLA